MSSAPDWRSTLLVFTLAFTAVSCGKKQEVPQSCASQQLLSNTGSTGSASVFNPDPMLASGDASLTPTSGDLDQFRTNVTLSHLGGKGVLEGQYVDVRNGLGCDEWFGASDPGNQFVYSHSDPRFQEAMAYYHGDTYRSSLDSLGYLAPSTPVRIVAHCELDDNSYYNRTVDPLTHQILEEHVCLGDSVATPGASYADDASVIVHELQHATTEDSYSLKWELGTFMYDEAGALNEAISDFMALMYSDPLTDSFFDDRVFSRWALGTFIPGESGIRGAHRCPTYDPTYPNCTGFPTFSATNNTISYVYPDGLGWPYANQYTGPGYARSAFLMNPSQEEIHQSGVLMEGALWDVYQALKGTHGGSDQEARAVATQVVLEAVRQLPKPTPPLHFAPATYRAFAQAMVDSASLLQLPSSDQDAISGALTERGLLGGTLLASAWSAVGPGTSATPGLRIEDSPVVLKPWLLQMGVDPSLITQGLSTGMNHELDPGEVVAVWFDIQNNSDVTAGGVEVTVSSSDPEITFMDGSVNQGPISSSSAQIFYQKINGTSIVSDLASSDPAFQVPTGNSYFLTDPFYGRDWQRAIWIRVSPTASHGKTVTFHVQATPSNGSTSTTDFTAVIN